MRTIEFFQYYWHTRKRTYKEIEGDKDELFKEVNTLIQAKTDFEGYFKDTSDELKW